MLTHWPDMLWHLMERSHHWLHLCWSSNVCCETIYREEEYRLVLHSNSPITCPRSLPLSPWYYITAHVMWVATRRAEGYISWTNGMDLPFVQDQRCVTQKYVCNCLLTLWFLPGCCHELSICSFFAVSALQILCETCHTKSRRRRCIVWMLAIHHHRSVPYQSFKSLVYCA